MRFFGADARLKPAELFGPAPATDVPAEVAAACGATANPAFAEAIASLDLAPCLCCCRARNFGVASRAEAALALILEYFSQEAFAASGARRFVEEALAAKAVPPALARRFRHSGRASASSPTAALARAANRVPGVAAVVVGHPWQAGPRDLGAAGSAGVALVVAATPEARRLLRRVSRAVKLAVRPARAAETLLLRVRVSSLVVDAYGVDLAGFEAAVKRAARKIEARQKKGTSAPNPAEARRSCKTRRASKARRKAHHLAQK